MVSRPLLVPATLTLTDVSSVTVQSRTKKEFPWKRPEIFQQDEGYADFVKSKAPVIEPELAIRPKPSVAETAKEDSAKIEPVKTTASEPQPAKAEAAEAEADKAGPDLVEIFKAEAAKIRAAGKTGATTWSPEIMTMIFDEIFGAEARFEGMGGFDLPLEAGVAEVVGPEAIKRAATLLPGSIELKPVSLGWDRFKLCLRFGSFVEPGRDDFPVRLYHLAWAWCLLVQWKENLFRQEDREKVPSIYDGMHSVMEEWTRRAGKKLAGLSLCGRVWARNVRDDMADLESEEARERLFDAVSKELASSRGQDDEARACGIVDWAGSDTEKLGGGSRSRAYLAIEAMCKYCESVTGEEKLGIIAQKMRPDQMHVAPSL